MAEMTQKELDVLKEWLKKFQASENYCNQFFEEGKENYKLYKSYKTAGEKVYRHDIFVPYSFAYTEDMTSYLMLSVLASPVTFSLLPRLNGVSPELCFELEQLVHWALTEESTEFVLELEELIKNVNIFNVGYLVNYPVVEDIEIPSTLMPGESRSELAFERLHLDSPSTLDVFPEPRIKRLSRMEWVIKRSYEDWNILKKNEKREGYKNLELAKGGFVDADPVTKLLSDIGMVSTHPYTYDEKESGPIELLDCMSGGDVITIAGRKAVIRDTTEGDMKPFIFDFPMLDCRTTGAPGEFFGDALLQSIKPLQKEMNITRSQRRENISLVLNKLFMLDLMAGEIDLSTLFSAPGNVIMGSGTQQALTEFPIQDVTRSSFKETEEISYDMESTSAMWSYARGATPRRRETATGIIRLQQAAQSRNEWILRKVDAYILRPLCRRLIVYLREFLSRSDYAAIVGRDNRASEFYSLSPEDVKKLIQIMPLTESIVSIKEVDMNQFLQAFDRLIQLPPELVNHVGLIKTLLQKLGQKNVKEILPQLSPQGQAGAVQAMQSMQQAAPLPPGAPPQPAAPGGM